MKTIFEEYGKFIITAIVVIALIAVIFGVVKITDVMGGAVDVEASLATSRSEEAVGDIAIREKPTINISSSASTHIYADDIFQPLASVSCLDADGSEISASVVDIVFIDNANGTQTNVLSKYDSANDKFDIETAIGKTGTLAVTYKATDGYSLTTIRTISFVVDVARS